ncbi:MAG TPA: glutathione peroxidase [Ruminococcaceae bacterium]|nr:glutathione peroxidase [Oscillospiraceae bacterium]
MSIYDFTVKDNHGESVSLKKYEGKVLLIVNTATQCGLTPQYTALQALYNKYKNAGLEILDFPCNQFMNQAPEDDAGIDEFCSLYYDTTFPRFAKIDVNGKNAAPLYVWLKEQAPEDKGDEKAKTFEEKVKLLTLDNKKSDIKWNFGKFLIDRKGGVTARYSPAYMIGNIDRDIEALLQEGR